jgi:hypothetical protein
VTWFILLSFSGSSLLCLWLDSSCYLSLEAVCCCVCDLIHLVIFPWSYLVGVHVFIYEILLKVALKTITLTPQHVSDRTFFTGYRYSPITLNEWSPRHKKLLFGKEHSNAKSWTQSATSTPCLYGNRTHNVSSDRHWLHS